MQRSAYYICTALLILGLSTAARAEDPSWVGVFFNDEQVTSPRLPKPLTYTVHCRRAVEK